MKHSIFISCHDGVLTNLHLLAHTRISGTIIITSDFSFSEHGSEQHFALLVPSSPHTLIPEPTVTRSQAAACHSHPLCMSCTCTGGLCNGPVGRPLGMPCICNDARLIKTFCHPGHMAVFLCKDLKGFQLDFCLWPPSGLHV